MPGNNVKVPLLDRSDSPKVTLVERKDPPGPEPAGEHGHRQVGKPQVEVGIPSIECERRVIVRCVESGTLVASRSQVLEEGPPGGSAKPLVEQIVDLSSHRGRDEQAAPLRAEEAEDLFSREARASSASATSGGRISR